MTKGGPARERFDLWPDDSPEIGALPAGLRPHLRVYPAGPDPAPAVVVFPGGGYGMVSEREGEPVAGWLNRAGFTAIVVTYRVAPHRYPAALRDAIRAVRLTRHHGHAWGVQPDRLAVMGFSAGGHLAGSLATLGDTALPGVEPDDLVAVSPIPDALVLCYPVIAFTAPFAHEGSVMNQHGGAVTEATRREWSLDRRVTVATPPTFLWHTAPDAPVPVENSLLFAGALAAHRVPFALHVFPHGEHGLNLAADEPLASAWPDLCAAWLHDTLGRHGARDTSLTPGGAG